MITSAFRVAELKGYELSLVWSEHVTDHGQHFHGPFSYYFDSEFQESRPPLRGVNVRLPKPVEGYSFTLDDSIFDGHDIYVSEWTHNIFLSSDLANYSFNTLTDSYYDYLNRVTLPSVAVKSYMNQHYEIDEGFDRLNFLGVHVRKGAFIGNLDHAFSNAQAISNSLISLSTLRVLKYLNRDSVFLCGQNPQDIEEVCLWLRCFGVKLMTHSTQSFPPPPMTASNSPIHSVKAVADFVTLRSSANVLSTSTSTFGALASLRPSNIRFIMKPDGSIAVLSTILGSGSGI